MQSYSKNDDNYHDSSPDLSLECGLVAPSLSLPDRIDDDEDEENSNQHRLHQHHHHHHQRHDHRHDHSNDDGDDHHDEDDQDDDDEDDDQQLAISPLTTMLDSPRKNKRHRRSKSLPIQGQKGSHFRPFRSSLAPHAYATNSNATTEQVDDSVVMTLSDSDASDHDSGGGGGHHHRHHHHTNHHHHHYHNHRIRRYPSGDWEGHHSADDEGTNENNDIDDD
jgi:hypothetical protein